MRVKITTGAIRCDNPPLLRAGPGVGRRGDRKMRHEGTPLGESGLSPVGIASATPEEDIERGSPTTLKSPLLYLMITPSGECRAGCPVGPG